MITYRFEKAMNRMTDDKIIAADRNNSGIKTVFSVWVANEDIPTFIDSLESWAQQGMTGHEVESSRNDDTRE